jgi:hypothetical protein
MMHAEESPRAVEYFVNGATLVATILIPSIRQPEQVTQIKNELLAAAQECVPRIVVLDMCCVEFMGSSGFLACLALRRIPSVAEVVLCNLHTNVREVFALCRLIPTGAEQSAPFAVADTLEQALDEYR